MPLLKPIKAAKITAYDPPTGTWKIDPDIAKLYGNVGPTEGTYGREYPDQFTWQVDVSGYPSRDAAEDDRKGSEVEGRWMLSDLLHASQKTTPLTLARVDDPEEPDESNADLIADWQSDRPDGVLWLYASKVYFTADLDLEPADVRALLNVEVNKRRLMLEKAHALQAMTDDYDRPRRRETIPQQVRLEVWQRDGGRCVECDSQQKLEFDHVIPLAMGGSNTVRNLQLLCEVCNRRKGASLG